METMGNNATGETCTILLYARGRVRGVKDYLYGTTMRCELLRRFVALR